MSKLDEIDFVKKLLNVYKGGTLYQDLKESGFTQIDHDRPFDDARSHVHDINIESTSKLYKIIEWVFTMIFIIMTLNKC